MCFFSTLINWLNIDNVEIGEKSSMMISHVFLLLSRNGSYIFLDREQVTRHSEIIHETSLDIRFQANEEGMYCLAKFQRFQWISQEYAA